MAYLSDEVNCKKCYQLKDLKEQLEFEKLENSILRAENKILIEKIKNQRTSTPSNPSASQFNISNCEAVRHVHVRPQNQADTSRWIGMDWNDVRP